jgi:sterol desaturase/sphingolipid hydroxylase (fatty acid hydroxylase superfamily)
MAGAIGWAAPPLEFVVGNAKVT